jgi:hypothetical protein
LVHVRSATRGARHVTRLNRFLLLWYLLEYRARINNFRVQSITFFQR